MNLSILIAEDEVLTRMAVKEMLEKAEYLVCAETNDGLKAVELAKSMMPDLAVLDIKMPGLDGLEVAKVMHSLNIPVLLLTSYSQPNFIKRAEKVSVYGYLVKPVTERELLPAVQIAYARWKDMQSKCEELSEVKNQLKNQKIIAHGKALLAQEKGITEYQAHQLLIQQAMSTRTTLVNAANRIIQQANKSDKQG